ncbi:MAG: TIGR02281 family clan AA aspartic protease [Sphingomonadaceae bacterium]
MTGDEVAQIAGGVAALTLVVSSLAARRLPLAQTVRMALIWVAVFSGVFVLFLFRGEVGVVWDRAVAELGGTSAKAVGNTYRIPKSDDGHFWVRARVNGTPVRFMVDTGASVTALSDVSARAANVETSSGFGVIVETANGTVENRRARIERLEVGPIVIENAPALISETLGETNLLGMSFLSALRGWRVEGDTLVLEP